MKSFLTYIGSKKKFMKELNFPEKINNYYDPFVGGGSVYFEINNRYHVKKNYINDLDKELINVYMQIKNNFDELLKVLEKLTKERTREEFQKVVDEYNTNKKDKLLLAAMYIYLNKRSYNGKLNYRKKNPGFIKPSYSKFRSKYNIHKEKDLRKLTKTIKETDIQSLDYKEFLSNKPKEGDFVFIDPPYFVRSVKQYYKNIFEIDDYKTLKGVCDGLNDKKVNFMITLNDNDDLKEIFRGYNIRVFGKYSISSREHIEKEMIITNY